MFSIKSHLGFFQGELLLTSESEVEAGKKKIQSNIATGGATFLMLPNLSILATHNFVLTLYVFNYYAEELS